MISVGRVVEAMDVPLEGVAAFRRHDGQVRQGAEELHFPAQERLLPPVRVQLDKGIVAHLLGEKSGAFSVEDRLKFHVIA